MYINVHRKTAYVKLKGEHSRALYQIPQVEGLHFVRNRITSILLLGGFFKLGRSFCFFKILLLGGFLRGRSLVTAGKPDARLDESLI